jgi:hypothetical protein
MHKLLKLIIVVLATLALNACNLGSTASNSGSNEISGAWGWINGSAESGAFGVYGSLGVSSITSIPGSRAIAVSWTDKNGNLWMFGGNGNGASTTGDLNDLWEFSPLNNQWTWISGSSSVNVHGIYGTLGSFATGNQPGSRYGGVSWVDNNNNLWMFGGYGYDAQSVLPGTLNDLWEFNITTSQWRWVGGESSTGATGVYGALGVPADSNIPGARLGAVSFVDSNGNLVLFGGAADLALTNKLNDLWKYNINTNQWTWISGESGFNQSGIYGVQGVAQSYTAPGARLDAVGWSDSKGHLWIFGGAGYAANTPPGNLNDLWQYNETTGQWTWMSGSNQSGASGAYGTKGVASPNSIPGAREHRVPISSTDNQGNLWMFGGYGNGATTTGDLNDLWYYNSSTNQWTWVSGSTEAGASGVYGTQGVLSVNNVPGARKDSVGWFDQTGDLWIFGGSNTGENNIVGNLNDLWKFSQ